MRFPGRGWAGPLGATRGVWGPSVRAAGAHGDVPFGTGHPVGGQGPGQCCPSRPAPCAPVPTVASACAPPGPRPHLRRRGVNPRRLASPRGRVRSQPWLRGPPRPRPRACQRTRPVSLCTSTWPSPVGQVAPTWGVPGGGRGLPARGALPARPGCLCWEELAPSWVTGTPAVTPPDALPHVASLGFQEDDGTAGAVPPAACGGQGREAGTARSPELGAGLQPGPATVS